MSKLLIAIKTKYNEMSKTEKKIADYILSNPNSIGPMSITDFAEVTNASEATIVRFAKRLGCSGYIQFKLWLAKEENTHHIVNESISDDDELLTMYSKISDDVYSSFIKTKKVLSEELLKKAYDLIVGSKRIVLLGVGNSYVMCLDFCHKLLRLGLNASVAVDSHFGLIYACQSDENTLVIAVSHSGYTRDIYDSVITAKEKGAKVLTITSDPKSPIAVNSNMVITTNSDENNYRILGLSSRYAELLIFDTIYSYAVIHLQGAKELIEDVEERISIKRVTKKGR